MRMEEIVEETDGKHEKMVEITLKIIGPARPSRLHVPSSLRVRFTLLISMYFYVINCLFVNKNYEM